MAYLRDLDKCRGCSYRKAVCQLFNKMNSDLGVYCRSCGRNALKKLLRQENNIPIMNVKNRPPAKRSAQRPAP